MVTFILVSIGIVSKGGELPCPLDADGRFTEEIADFQGMCVLSSEPCDINHARLLYYVLHRNV